MIQRIQSIFLLLAGISLALLFLGPFDFVTTSDSNNISPLLADGVYDVYDHIGLILLTCLSVVLSFAAILLYRNRKSQIRLSLFAVICILALLILAIVIWYTQAASSNLVSIGLGLLPIFVSIVLLFLARSSIKKDDRLVKSMDRLR